MIRYIKLLAAEIADTLNYPFFEWTIDNEFTGDKEEYQCIRGFHLALAAIVLSFLIF